MNVFKNTMISAQAAHSRLRAFVPSRVSTSARIRTFVATCLMLGFSITAHAQFPGSGTENNPYIIKTAAELAQLATLVNAGTSPHADAGVYYRVDQHIDLSGYPNWTPIGQYGANTFKGNIDGNGRVISNLKITGTSSYRGLFGVVGGGNIKNIALTDVSISGGTYTGGIAGSIGNGGSLINCYVSGVINGSTYTGGIAGSVLGTAITNCYTAATVSGSGFCVGGIAGSIGNLSSSLLGSVTNCYATGAISGTSGTGGIVGEIQSSGSNCKIECCVALNPSISRTGSGSATSFGRILGNNGGIDNLGNAAWEEMTVLGEIVSDWWGSNHGDDLPTDEAINKEFYEDMLFPFGNTVTAPWKWDNAASYQLPLLYWQTAPYPNMPAHLILPENYHPDDKEGLRAFLRQPSAVEGKINAQQLGLNVSDTTNWQTDEAWVAKVINLTWNDETPKRLIFVKPFSRSLAGNLDATKWTALEELNCQNNQITTLNISGCMELRVLACDRNELSTLNLSGLIKLEGVQCYKNNFTSLDVSDLTALEYLNCDANKLTTLNVSSNTALKSLYCYNNQLQTLDVSSNTALEYLSCSDNQLTSLDVSGLTALATLHCSHNQLTSLNVNGCTALERIYCYHNQFISLDVSSNMALQYFGCGDNPLTSLKLNTTLLGLYCENTKLASLDLSKNPFLEELECANNEFTSLDFSNCPKFLYLYSDNNRLPLSDLYAASTIIGNNEEDTRNRKLGSQTLLPRSVLIDTELFADQAILGSSITQYVVLKGGIPAPTSDYTVTSGKLTFHTLGVYVVTMTNAAIISHEDYPAEATVWLTVKESLNNNATLATLTVSEGVLTPTFNNTIYQYTVNVANAVAAITITATPTDPNATVSGATGTHALNTGANTFSITVTAEDGTTKLDYTVTVNRDNGVGIGELQVTSYELQVYPNPTRGEIQVTSYELQVTRIEVYDVMGRMVTPLNPPEGGRLPSFGGVGGGNISHLPSGIYFLRIQTETGVVVRKVIKN